MLTGDQITSIARPYWLVFAALLVASRILHFLVVVPTLRRHGFGRLTGLVTLNDYKELAAYKEICEREGKTLFWWYTEVLIVAMLLVGVVGWFLLCIGRGISR